MQLLRGIRILLHKEFLTEFRNTYSISAVLLYLFSTVFIIYTSFLNIPANVWNTLYWVIMLFITVNALLRSFDYENSHRSLYYYQVAHPLAIYLSKLIYNTIMVIVLAVIAYGIFALIAGNPVRDYGLFFLTLILSSIGFSSVFTFIASIGAKSGNSHMLTAILGFPCIIPILMESLKLSANALGLINDTSFTTDILIMCAINTTIIALSMILFPFVWRD